MEGRLEATVPPRPCRAGRRSTGFPAREMLPGSLPPAPKSAAVSWLTAPVLLSFLSATVCFLRAFYYLAPLVSDLVAFLSSRINSFSCTPLLPLR